VVSVDEQLAKIQAGQLGLITVRQALEAGCSYRSQRRRIRDGVLAVAHPGVLSSPLVPDTFEHRAYAAVLAAGVTAFASHDTAAHLWSLPLPHEPAIEVTTVIERRPRVRGVRMHRSGLLIDPDVTQVGVVPLATPERTAMDLSGRLDVRDLGRLVDDALRRRLTTLSRIAWMIDRLPRAPGRSPATMRAVLDLRVPSEERCESPLEDFVFESLRAYAVPLPVAQFEVMIEGRVRRIDFAYPPRYIALEAKGFEYHGLRSRSTRTC
jgi:hypothetical protein